MNRSLLLDNLRRFLNSRLNSRAKSGEDEYDLSYDDALFDLSIRNYFKSEYGAAQPSSGAFPRLLAAIRAHERGIETQTTRPVAAFLGVYRALRTSMAHRLVSGGVAAAIMLAVISSSSVSFLRSGDGAVVTEGSTPTATSTLSNEEAMELATIRDNRYITRRTAQSPDPAFYDPVELRIPPRVEAASGATTTGRWQRFGGQ